MIKASELEQSRKPINLIIARDEAKRKIKDQMAKGEALLSGSINSQEDLDKLKSESRMWSDFNKELLFRIFNTDEVSKEYDHAAFRIVSLGSPSFNLGISHAQKSVKTDLETLNSILGRLDLYDEVNTTQSNSNGVSTANDQLKDLHKDIYDKCHELYENRAYAEAAEKGFKIVRDKLRTLTGYETGSEAFGKTKLHVRGAAASNVDVDFNEAIKFLTMAIDRFRNEKSHTSDAKIDDPIRAFEYLCLSSLAMRFLENTEMLS